MRTKRRKQLSNVRRYKRKRLCVYSKFICVVDGDMVSLETRCCGRRVVLCCDTYPKMVGWVNRLKHDMETGVYESLGSTRKRAAVEEAQVILRES